VRLASAPIQPPGGVRRLRWCESLHGDWQDNCSDTVKHHSNFRLRWAFRWKTDFGMCAVLRQRLVLNIYAFFNLADIPNSHPNNGIVSRHLTPRTGLLWSRVFIPINRQSPIAFWNKGAQRRQSISNPRLVSAQKYGCLIRDDFNWERYLCVSHDMIP